MRKTLLRLVLGAALLLPLAVPTAATAGNRDGGPCDRAVDSEHLAEYPNIESDETFCEIGYFGFRLEGGPYSAISLGFHNEIYLRNVVNVYTELGLGFGSQARDGSLDWVPSPFANAYVGYPLDWVKHRRNKRWVVSESLSGNILTTNFFNVDVPNHRRFIPEVGLMYGRPVHLAPKDERLPFEDRLVIAPSAGFRWVRTYRLNMQAVDGPSGDRWTGRVDNRAWIAAHVIPASFNGPNENVGFDVEFGIPNSIGRINQSINMTLAGGLMPNGTVFARWGIEAMLKRY